MSSVGIFVFLIPFLSVWRYERQWLKCPVTEQKSELSFYIEEKLVDGTRVSPCSRVATPFFGFDSDQSK